MISVVTGSMHREVWGASTAVRADLSWECKDSTIRGDSSGVLCISGRGRRRVAKARGVGERGALDCDVHSSGRD